MNTHFGFTQEVLFCTEEETSIHISSIESNATFKGKGTVIVEATSNGGFKFIPLEAKALLLRQRRRERYIEGQMLLILGKPRIWRCIRY